MHKTGDKELVLIVVHLTRMDLGNGLGGLLKQKGRETTDRRLFSISYLPVFPVFQYVAECQHVNIYNKENINKIEKLVKPGPIPIAIQSIYLGVSF